MRNGRRLAMIFSALLCSVGRLDWEVVMTRKIALVGVMCAFLCLGTFAQDSYDDHLAQAKSLITQQKYSDAVKEGEKAIALDERRWEAYVIAAKGYSSQQLYDDAIGMLQTALAHAPDDKKPLIRDAIAECRKDINSTPSAVSVASNPKAETLVSPPAPATSPTQAEIVLWKSIEKSDNPDDFRAYLRAYPTGAFVPLAQSRLAPFERKAAEDLLKNGQPDNAAQVFQRACAAGDVRACSDLEALRSLDLSQQACDSGDIHKCVIAASMYEKDSVAKDLDRAQQLYQRACQAAEAEGCKGLDRMAYTIAVYYNDSKRKAWGHLTLTRNGAQFLENGTVTFSFSKEDVVDIQDNVFFVLHKPYQFVSIPEEGVQKQYQQGSDNDQLDFLDQLVAIWGWKWSSDHRQIVRPTDAGDSSQH